MESGLPERGGVEIFGDFLFQEYSRYGHTPITEMAGPMAGVAADVFALYNDAKDGRWGKVQQEGLEDVQTQHPWPEPLLPGLASVWKGLGTE